MNRLFDLTGKRALITGSSKGIGFTLAEGLAEAGASIVLNARSAERLRAAEKTLKEKGFEAASFCFDVTQPGEIQTAIDDIETKLGPIDILINNAGMQARGALEDYDLETWRRLMETNVNSMFYVTRVVAKYMIERGQGKIINIGSVQSMTGRPTIAPYTASKGAVLNLTKGMAIDWGPKGLQINAIGPGYFKTELNQALVYNPEFSNWLTGRTPARRWGNLDELKGAAIFLASEASSFINGHMIYVDGGLLAQL